MSHSYGGAFLSTSLIGSASDGEPNWECQFHLLNLNMKNMILISNVNCPKLIVWSDSSELQQKYGVGI